MVKNHPVPLKRRSIILVGMIVLLPVLIKASSGDSNEGFTTSDGQYRTYLVHTPPGYDGTKELALVISLHAGWADGASQAAVSGMSDKADAEDFIVVYPNAFSPGWMNPDTLFLSEIIDTLRERYAVDSLRVYMTGYSAGACMSHWMACKLSGRVAAIAPVAGTMFAYDRPGCHPDNPISVISFNARNDPELPYGGGGDFIGVEETSSDWAEHIGCDQGPDTFYDENGALRQTWARSDSICEVVLWTTKEGGHGWPKESSPNKISANDLMWEFFKAHPLTHWKPAVDEHKCVNPAHPGCILDPLNSKIFSRFINIRFSLQSSESVTLRLYNASGSEVAVIRKGVVEAGEHEAIIDASNLPCGVYFYRLSSPHGTQTRNILVVK
jgi:polyhydroxybutyrate depolymerase